MHATRVRTRTHGMTLIETLFASALGAGLLIVLLSLYQRALSHHTFAENRRSASEILFTAERALSNDLQYAGRLPCGHGGQHFNLVRTQQSTPWLRLFEAPVQILSAHGNDELMVLKTDTPVPLLEHDLEKAQLTLTHAADFKRGDLLVLCDGDFTVLLQITRDAGRLLGYDHDVRVSPGNCVSAFVAVGCGPEHHRFTAGALVARYAPVVFFISNTGSGPTLARKRLVSTRNKHNVRARLLSESVIENIAILRAQVGIADAGGRVVLTRKPPDHWGDRRPVLLDIGIVATTPPNSQQPEEALHVLGETVGTGLGTSKRHRVAHEFSIAL